MKLTPIISADGRDPEFTLTGDPGDAAVSRTWHAEKSSVDLTGQLPGIVDLLYYYEDFRDKCPPPASG